MKGMGWRIQAIAKYFHANMCTITTAVSKSQFSIPSADINFYHANEGSYHSMFYSTFVKDTFTL